MLPRLLGLRPIWRWWLLANLPSIVIHLAIGLFHGFFDYSLTVRWLGDTSVPCEPTAKEVEIFGLVADVSKVIVPPYDVPKLLTSIGWWKRLDLHPIDQAGRTGYRRPLHAGSWYRKAEPQDSEIAWHHWIYLSGHSPGSETWDAAFDELMYHNTIYPAANGAGFHHASCRQSGLCTRWLIPGPALVHLTTESLDGKRHQIEVGSETYDKVTMLFLKLDKQLDDAKGPKRDPFDQLRSLTHDAEAWKHGCHTRSEEQHLSHLQQLNREVMRKQYPWSYKPIMSARATIVARLWPRGVFVHPSIAMVAYEVPRLSVIIARSAWDFLSSTVGTVKDQPGSEVAVEISEVDRENKALDLAAGFVQCAEEGAEFLQWTMTPSAWDTIDKLRELLPKERRRALEEGQVTCGLDWPTQ